MSLGNGIGKNDLGRKKRNGANNLRRFQKEGKNERVINNIT